MLTTNLAARLCTLSTDKGFILKSISVLQTDCTDVHNPLPYWPVGAFGIQPESPSFCVVLAAYYAYKQLLRPYYIWQCKAKLATESIKLAAVKLKTVKVDKLPL
jgi:hypothetical protein